MNRRDHWETVFREKRTPELSWFQEKPGPSLELIDRCGLTRDSGIIDVGAGAATLVDELLDRGFLSLGALDVSDAALQESRDRLGQRAVEVEWYSADVTRFEPSRRWMLWHDRALFHFLTDEADRAAYKKVLGRALCPGGHVIIATFGPEGPSKCSGLDVVRYSPESLQEELGPEYAWLESLEDPHQTPSGKTQAFIFSLFRRGI